MEAQVLDSSDSEIGLSFMETDIATLYIIQHELLKNPDVKFAGVIVKHPLTNECRMRVSSESDPARNIADAADAAIQAANEMRDALNTDVRV
jgi:DNA-directed RNA polymerase subunit L